MAADETQYVLHTYFRSSCSARVRISLNLKGIPYEPVFFNLLKDEHKSERNVATNPLGFVPSLVVQSGEDAGAVFTQSLAILEYFEEKYPDKVPLLPPRADLAGRAHVRALANVIACDVQPVTNMRILRKVTELGGSTEDWAKWLITEGLAAYDKLATPTAGKFSFGDSITLADVCLVPAIHGALRFGIDLEQFPTVKRAFEEMSKVDAVTKASWKHQPDCPESLR